MLSVMGRETVILLRVPERRKTVDVGERIPQKLKKRQERSARGLSPSNLVLMITEGINTVSDRSS